MATEPAPAAPLTAASVQFGARGAAADRYGDHYHGPAGALMQARSVFLAQTGLPAGWSGCPVFTVLETGFGLGFNFLATWLAWQQDPQRCARLHFVSVEKHPVALADLARAHAAEPELAALARALRQQLPLPVAGLHRLSFAGGRVTLTLAYGDGAAALAGLCLQADAIFMDGFAPDRNPDLWTPAVCAELARLARAGARLASWCTAGDVRRALTGQGFQVRRQPGIAGKFHMLQGERAALPPGVQDGQTAATLVPPAAPAARTVAIIGAGLAGTTLARALLQRGWQVTLLEAAAGPGQAASGNPSGVVRPLWSRDDNPVTRLTRSAFLHATRAWAAGHDDGGGPVALPRAGWHPTGVLQLAHDAGQAARWSDQLPASGWPGDYVQWLDAAAVQRRCGRAGTHGGLLFALGGWAEPARLCAEAFAGQAYWPGTLVSRWNCRVAALQPAGTGGTGWQLLSADGHCVASAAHVVVCSGAGDLPGMTGLPSASPPPDNASRTAAQAFLPDTARALQALRGEITQLAVSGAAPDLVICDEGYLSPLPDGSLSIGATYDRSGPATPTLAGMQENLARAARIGGYVATAADVMGGRVGWRSVAADRLPLAGPDPLLAGVWHLRALASRGVVWSPLMAELVACQLHGEPLPLQRSDCLRVSPARAVLHR